MTIALITGANKGIGYEVARGLAAEGVTVLAAARDQERGARAAAEIGARFVQLDVTSAESIAAAAKQVAADYGTLDVLVNNAGIAQGGWVPSEVEMEPLRAVYETNVFGVVAVTNAFIPLLRASPAPRIVNVSSEVGSLSKAIDPADPLYALTGLAYQSSKSALNMVTLCYAKELTAFKVNACSPGYCATDLNGFSGPRTPQRGAEVVIRLALAADGPTGTFVDEDGPIPW
ncbi:SDR family oxidoreductase [Streptosporangiaceae bacterium NEAU-GS5]|nr:SDR family oxidoreductase [Streptosporangiaceae bacterium NEAU-GS5]